MTKKLLSIGEFAHETGLTTSALRFYADTGVLIPADIDPFTGYRSYAPEQVVSGCLIHQLRNTRMPLAGIQDVLAASSRDAAVIVRRHIEALGESTATAITAAEATITQLCGEQVSAAQPGYAAEPPESHVLRGAVGVLGTAGTVGAAGTVGMADTAATVGTADTTDTTGTVVHWVAGPVAASAVDAVLPATVLDPDLPILGTVLIELSAEGIRFTATDRYRLATRTVASTNSTWSSGDADWAGNGNPEDGNTSDNDAYNNDHDHDPAHDQAHTRATDMSGGHSWSGPVSAQHLQELLSQMRRSGTVGFSGGGGVLRVELTEVATGAGAGSDVSDGMGIDSGIDSGTVVEIPVSAEDFPDYRLMLDSLPEPTTQVIAESAALLRAVEDAGARIRFVVEPGSVMVGEMAVAAQVSGVPDRAEFLLTTLYPALAGAVGPDIVLDFRGPEQPLSIRSAVRDDLTSVLMPVALDEVAESVGESTGS